MLNDLRYALRSLASAPAFTLVAVASLAVGIGMNTALFTVVNAVLLRPLPVSHPEQLVDVYTTSDTEHSSTSWLDYLDLRDRATVFDGLVGHSLMFANVSREGRSRVVMGEIVTANYFDVLGVPAALGRTFAPGEDSAENGNRVAILSEGFWRREYGADPSVVGRALRLRGADYEIIGVLPRKFTGVTPGIAAEIWVPASMVADVEPVGMNDAVPSPTGTTRLQQRGQRWMFVKGRVRTGVSVAQVRAEVSSVMAANEREHPATNRERRAVVVPARDVRIHPLVDGALVPGAAALMVSVGLVLLIACANIANMLLARATGRSREIAIRLAIGASRWRIVRQLLAESLLLAAVGGWLGALIARWATGLLSALPLSLPIAITLDVRPDWRVLTFATIASIVTGALFGLAPALQSARPDLVPTLKGDVTSRGRGALLTARNVLVVAQVAVCFVLLVASGLLLRSLGAARSADVGFDTRGLAVSTLDLRMHRYTAERGAQFYRTALERIRALPGVTSASLVERLPFSPNIHTQTVFLDGRAYGPGERGTVIDTTRVSAGYFRTLGARLVEGRDFDDRDTPASPGVIVINQVMAARLWPGESAIGRRIRIRAADGPVFEVVGVAADYKVRTVGEAPRPFLHFARSQTYNPSATILARTAGDASQLAATVRRELLALEPGLVFIENQTMEDSVATTLLPARLAAGAVSIAGAVAMLLAAAGLYGVIAFSVSRRTREIGIRMALGARPAAVLGLVVRQGMALVGAGVAIGSLAAIAAGRAAASALYGLSAFDPMVFAGAALLMAAVAGAANLVPARRAARVDPMIALRSQ